MQPIKPVLNRHERGEISIKHIRDLYHDIFKSGKTPQ